MAVCVLRTGSHGGEGRRVRWPPYSQWERSALKKKFLGDWKSLDFLESFWNPVHDQRDLFQYRRASEVWRKRLSGLTFTAISRESGIDQRKACALVSGKNLRPYLLQMYLNRQTLDNPRPGWKWVLECTPKPMNMFPRRVMVPEKIQGYPDILDFLKQFPPASIDHLSLKFFELSSEWVEQHKPILFGFLIGFLMGDAGKYFPEYLTCSRHYTKTSLSTNMKSIDSNIRILTYVRLCLSILGVWSHEISPAPGTIRWTSQSSNLITWILRVCLGLKSHERTSREAVRMDWLRPCPPDFQTSVIQGIAESDGSVDVHGYYASIGSVPNSVFLKKVLASIGTPSRIHPKHNPTQVRINLLPALELPLFNPIINSYRYQSLLTHANSRGFLPPSPIFSRP